MPLNHIEKVLFLEIPVTILYEFGRGSWKRNVFEKIRLLMCIIVACNDGGIQYGSIRESTVCRRSCNA